MGTRKHVSAGQTAGVPVFDSYARLSKNPNTGEFEKIETQWADNRRVIERSQYAAFAIRRAREIEHRINPDGDDE